MQLEITVLLVSQTQHMPKKENVFSALNSILIASSVKARTHAQDVPLKNTSLTHPQDCVLCAILNWKDASCVTHQQNAQNVSIISITFMLISVNLAPLSASSVWNAKNLEFAQNANLLMHF